MRAPLVLPVSLGTEFSIAGAAAAGVSAKRLRRAPVVVPFRGVRMTLLPELADEHPAERWRREILQLVDACRVWMPEHAFFSHRTAAVIWGLPVDPFPDTALDVSVMHPSRALRSRGVVGRALRPSLVHVVRHRGTRVTTPASTWATLGAVAARDELVAVGDAVVRIHRHPGGFGPPDRPPLGSVDQLQAVIDAGRRPGVESLRSALPLIRTGSSSRRETDLRLAILDAGLPEPALDVDVLDGRGRFLGCSELAYPEFRTALEYESDHHRVSRAQWDRDIDKYQLYLESGWRTVRVTTRLLDRARPELIRRVRTTLREQGWDGELAGPARSSLRAL